MKKWSKVSLKDIRYSDVIHLTDEMKETFELHFGEKGVILNEVQGEMIVVGFPNGVETISQVYLYEIEVEETHLLVVRDKNDFDNIKIIGYNNKEEVEEAYKLWVQSESSPFGDEDAFTIKLEMK